MILAEITSALAAARSSAPTGFRVMTWADRREVGLKRGIPLTFATMKDLADALIDEARSEFGMPKGKGKIFSGGIAPNGGRENVDVEAGGEVVSMLFDSDHSGDVEKLCEVLNTAGIAYYAQRRSEPGKQAKFHTRVWFATPLRPTAAAKERHRSLLKHVLTVIGEAIGIQFDLSQGNGFAPEEFLYQIRPDHPAETVETFWAEGSPFDVEAFASATGWTGAPTAARARSGPAPASGDFFAAMKARAAAPAVVSMTPEETRAAVARGIARNRQPERHGTLQAFAAGRSFAEHGERNATAQRLCSWLAWFTEGRGDVGTIFDMFSGSLAAMAGTKLVETLEPMVIRAMDDAARKIGEQHARDARIAAAFTGRRARMGA